MQNISRKTIFVYLIYSCWLGLLGCSHFLPAKSFNVSPVAEVKAVELRLKAQVNQPERTKYYSHSYIKSYSEGQLLREREEIVEFKVLAKVLKEDQAKGFIHTLVETVEKDGLVDLHDLAFPEKGERIEIIYKPNAGVVYAGDYPKTSVFYVPPLSLPNGAVKVGDTWEMSHSWINMKNSIPLHIEMVTIFKALVPCGQEALCADLEVSGDVGLIASLDKSTQLVSQISGRLLFSVHSGRVIWSLIRTQEQLKVADSRMDIQSCMLSVLEEPAVEVWPGIDSDKCDPKLTTISAAPGITPLSPAK